MALPLVSIVIPTFNEQDYLLNTLDKLRRQIIYNGIEVVIADYDADQNRLTKNIASRATSWFRPGRFKVIDVDKRGIGYARHQGALAASANILMSFDADAYFTDPAGVWKLIQPIVNGKTLMTCCNTMLDPNEAKDWEDKRIFMLADIVYRLWNVGESPCETGLTISRDAYFDIGGFPDVTIGEGTLLYAKFVMRYGLNSKVRIDDLYVQMSARRPKSLSKGLSLDGLIQAYDYTKAFRGGETLNVG